MGWAIRLESQSRDTNPRDLGLGQKSLGQSLDKNLWDRTPVTGVTVPCL